MNTVEIPIEQWNNIFEMNYWWIYQALKGETERGEVNYIINNNGIQSELSFNDEGQPVLKEIRK